MPLIKCILFGEEIHESTQTYWKLAFWHVAAISTRVAVALCCVVRALSSICFGITITTVLWGQIGIDTPGHWEGVLWKAE